MTAPVLIGGAGIAGLTAAIALAGQGFPCRVFERAERLDEVGAGIQLSPNATRILGRLGVLEHLGDSAVQPEAVLLRDAAKLKQRATIPLGTAGAQRWGAPYLVLHRADLQRALVAAAREHSRIELVTGVEAIEALCEERLSLIVAESDQRAQHPALVVVGADGVGSAVRKILQPSAAARFTGKLAWRTTLAADAPQARELLPATQVSVFLHPGVHLVAYPVSAGREINLVAVGRGPEAAGEDHAALLARAFKGAAPEVDALREAADQWTAWPIRTVDPRGCWTDPRGLVLIGDAAHAMSPFAAQGAAMAIEDAAVLALCLSGRDTDLAAALARYEKLRRPRILKVARRGALNELAWHAAGPVSLARNLVLSLRGPEKLAADMDWLYGWKLPEG